MNSIPKNTKLPTVIGMPHNATGSTRWKKALRPIAPLAGSITALLALPFSQTAQAADTAWSAWNGTTTDWGTATNWASNLPTASNSAMFNSTFANQPVLGATVTTQGIYLSTGVGQDVTITGSSSARVLNINGDATLGGQTNAGIMLDDSAKHNLTIGNLVTTTLTNSTGFYVNNAGTLTFNGSGSINLNGQTLTLGGTNTAGNIYISQGITNNGGTVNVNTSGTVTFSGASANYETKLTLTAGTLYVDNSTSRSVGNGTTSDALTLNGGNLVMASTYTTPSRNTTVNGNAQITSNANATTVTSGTTYTFGALGIGAQTLTIQGGSNVTSGTAGVTFAGTTLSGTSTFNINKPTNGGTTLLTIGALTNNGNTLTLTGNGNFAQSAAAVAGAGGITLGVSGGTAYSGTATLNQTNLFTGAVTVNSGVLVVSGNNGNLGAGTTSPGLILAGGQLSILDSTARTYTNGITSVSGNTTILSDRTSGGSGVTQTFNTLAINGSTLTVTLGTGGANITGGTQMVTFGATTMSGNPTFTVNNNTNGYTGTLTLGALNDGGTARTITKTGSGTLTLGSAATSLVANTTVNVQGGTLNSNNATALGSLATVNVTGGAGSVFNVGASGTISALNNSDANSADSVTIGAYTLTVGGTDNLTSSFSGVIGGASGALTKAGTGNLTLGGSTPNTYGGLTTVTSGTLYLNKSGAANAIAGGGLTIGAANNTAATVQYTGASSDMMGAGAVTIKGRGILDFNGATDTIGNVSIVSTGGTTTNLTPIVNTAGGGNLTIGALGITPVAGYTSVINAGTGTLTLGGNVTFTAATTGQAQISGNLNFGGAQRTFTVGLGTGANCDLLIDAAITDGGNGLIKAGTGRLTLSGANASYTGATTINAGTLQSANAGALANSASVGVNGTGTLAVNYGGGSDYAQADVDALLGKTTWGATTTAFAFDTTNASSGASYSGNLTMAANVIKLGANTLTLAGTNSYTGTTTVSAGTLLLADTSAVSNGGLGSGGGALVLNGGALQVASSASAQSISNNVTLTANSTLAGSQSLTVSGTFTNSGGSYSLTNNLTSGTLTLASTVNLSDASGTGRTLGFSGAGPVTISGLIQNYSGGAGTASGFQVNGGQVLTLTNSGNTFSGGVNLFAAGSVLVLANSTAAGTGLIQGNNSAVQATAPVVLANAFQINGGHTMTFSGANSISIGSLTNSGGNNNLTNSLTGGAALTISGTTYLQELTGNTAGRTLTIGGGANTTFNGPIVNGGTTGLLAGSLTIANTGTTTLNGANTYTGTTTLPMGSTLVLGNKSALGTGALTVSLPSNVSGSATLQASVDLSGANAIANAVNISSAGSNTTAEISGTNNITLAGNVSQTNSDITLKNDLGGGATLVISGSILPVSGRYVTFAGSGNTTVSGNIGISNGLFVNTTGTVTISGSTAPQNTFSDFTLQAGTLILGSPTASSTGRMRWNGGTLQAGIDLSGPNALPNSAILLTNNSTISGSNNIALSGTTPLTNNGGNSTLTNNLAGGTLGLAGNVYLSESATNGRTLTLAGSGNTTVSGTIANNSAISGTACNLTVTNTGTTTLSGQSVFTGTFSQTGAGTVSLTGTMNGPASVTINSPNAVFTESATGAIQGASTTLSVSNSTSTVTLLGTNSYGGATTVNGILQLGDGTLGHDPTLATSGIANNTQLRFNYYANQTIGSLFSGNGTIWQQGPGTLTITGSNSAGAVSIISGTLQVGDGTSGHDGPLTATSIFNNGVLAYNLYGSGTITAPISQSGALVKSGPGTLTLTGSNSYTGATTITGGTLQLNDSSLTTTSGVLNNGVFAVNANTNAQTLSCAMSGSGALVKGGTNTLTLTGSNSYTGPTTINSGTLQIGDGTTLGSINSTSGIANNGVLAYNFATGTRASASGISGSGSLVVTGSGTLTLTGSNSYTGNTTLTGGTMQISAANNIGSSGTLVLHGGALQVAGASPLTLANNVLLNVNGSTIASSQNLTLSGTFTNSGANNGLNFYMGASGTLTLSGPVNLSESSSIARVLVTGNSNTGYLTITGQVQDYIGGVGTAASGFQVNSGVLTLTNNSNNFSGGVNMFGAGSTLILGGSSVAGTGLIQGNSYTLQATTPVVLANAVQDNNGHTLTVSGTNSISIGSFTNSAGNNSITNSLTGGAALTISGTTYLQELTGNTAGRTLTVSGGANTTFNGPIVNGGTTGLLAGSLTIANTGTTTLNGANTYTGTTTVSAGTVVLGSGAAFGTSSLALSGATIQASTDLSGANALTTTSVVLSATSTTVSGANSITIDGNSSGFIGADTTLTNNLASGKTLMFTGDLVLKAFSASRWLYIAGSGNTTFSGTLSDNSTAGLSRIIVNSTGITTLSGNITYNGATQMNAATGTLILSGSNSGTGGVALTTGTLVINNNYALGAVGGTFSIAAGTIDSTVSGIGNASANPIAINGNFTFGGTNDLNLGSGPVTGSFARAITLNGTGKTLTLGGVWGNSNDGSNTLTVTGAGNTLSLGSIALENSGTTARTQTIAGSGNVTITGAVTNGSSTGATQGLTVASTGIATLSGLSSYNGAFQQTGAGAVSLTGTMNGPASVTVNNTAAVFNEGSGGAIQTGSFSLVKGLAILSGSNSYGGGTTLSSGTLQLGNANALGTGGLTFNSGKLDLAGNSVSVAAFSGSGGTVTSMATGTGTLITSVASGTSTYAGNIVNGTGAVALTNSGAGTLILSGSLTMAGLNANSGVTQLTQSGSIGAVSVAAGATLSVAANTGGNRNVLNVSSLTISGFTSGLATTNSAAPALLNADNVVGASTSMLAAAGQTAVGNASEAEPASPEAVPEPGSLGLLLAGALGMLGCRRRKAKVTQAPRL